MQAVAASDWDLRKMVDSARRSRLLGPVSPEKLLERLEAESKEAAANNTVRRHWREANEQKGYWRIESTVPLTAETFDLFFNGRMGYRAQFYRSPAAERTFNRSLVHRLIPAIRTALEHTRRTYPATWDQTERSLKGPHSKVWVTNDWVFYDDPKPLRPARWVAYWARRNGVAMGMFAPMPDEPEINLKGTWIGGETGEPWLPESKRDRDQNIHCSGWAY